MADPIPGKLTETSLVLDRGLSLQQWARAGETIGWMHKSSPWWLGDWLGYGETHFGEKYAQFVEETGLSARTLLRRARLSRQVAPERRREALSLSHHEAVLALLPSQQDELLALADKEGWTVGRLKAEARKVDTNATAKTERPALGALGDELYEAAIQFLDQRTDDARADARRVLVRACALWAERRDL
jgi:hypothetical protein